MCLKVKLWVFLNSALRRKWLQPSFFLWIVILVPAKFTEWAASGSLAEEKGSKYLTENQIVVVQPAAHPLTELWRLTIST
jgi:hypothetical protein